MRGPSGRRRRPRDARGGGACQCRPAERHDLRECDLGRGALMVTFEAHGDDATYSWQLGNGETAEVPPPARPTAPGCGP